VVIGGGSLAGGKGTVLGAVLGAMVSSILLNFLVLLDMGIWFQRFLLGLVIVMVVLFTSGSLNIWRKT
jgi:ribose/xylose/arabinose/galactoside ABC-type transport system permease subunit